AVELVTRHEARPHEIVSLAIYVLPTEQDRFFGNDPLGDMSRLSLIRQFLDYVYGSAKQLSSSSFSALDGGIDREMAQSVYYTLKQLLWLFNRFQPQRTAAVNEQARVLLGVMNPKNANAAEKPSRTTADDFLRKAESTVGERPRTIAFMRASAVALNEGDV